MEENKIYNMDCLKGLKEIKDESVSLIFADPPYNLIGLDNFVDLSVYRKWSNKWLDECVRVLDWEGTLIICGRPPVLNYLYIDLLEKGLVAREWITWHKVDSITPSKDKLSNNYECFAVFSKWTNRKFTHIPVQSKTANYSKERNVGSIWEHCKISSNHKEGTIHPTQKPIKFLDRMVNTFTDKGDLVLDPFMGSGTTAVSAKQNGRRFIGFELNKEYIEMIEKRLSETNYIKKLEFYEKELKD